MLPKTDNEKVINAAKTRFVQYLPTNLQSAVFFKCSDLIISEMNQLDFVEYHLRAYVCGKYKNTARLKGAVLEYIKGGFRTNYLEYISDFCKQEIEDNEIYEYMRAFLKAETLIKNEIKKPR